jgi:hypothetical protein
LAIGERRRIDEEGKLAAIDFSILINYIGLLIFHLASAEREYTARQYGPSFDPLHVRETLINSAYRRNIDNMKAPLRTDQDPP